jgi:hypothetical protein
MQSKANTVAQYLAELPADRRAAISAVRDVIRKNLDKDYEEGMLYGMIGYYVPHRIFPAGYHCDPTLPLCFAGLASQKNYMSVYLTCWADKDYLDWFHKAWAKTGKKLDMGKCCIRFKKLEDLALGVIGEAIRRVPVEKHIEDYESAMESNAKRKAKVRSKSKSSAAVGRGTRKRAKSVKRRAIRRKSAARV